jgi:hypothetical protein
MAGGANTPRDSAAARTPEAGTAWAAKRCVLADFTTIVGGRTRGAQKKV